MGCRIFGVGGLGSGLTVRGLGFKVWGSRSVACLSPDIRTANLTEPEP